MQLPRSPLLLPPPPPPARSVKADLSMRLLCDSFAFRLHKMATGGSDPSAIQLQLRRNAEELKDYLQDLGQWEDEIKKKEEYIIKQKPILKKVICQKCG